MATKLYPQDRAEFQRLLAYELEKHSTKSIAQVLAELTYIAHGHSDVANADDYQLLRTLRKGGLRKL